MKSLTKEQRIIRGVAASFSLHKKKIIQMLNNYGASIKPEATNEKVLSVLRGFLTSNDKFSKEFLKFTVDNGYISQSDLIIEGSLNQNKPNNYMNAAGESDFNFGEISSVSEASGMGSMWGSIISEGVGLVKGIFTKPEANTEALSAIMALETEKLKAQKQSNAKYWIAGAVVLSVMAITGIIIYKAKK